MGFQEEGGAGIPGEVMGESFTASGLTPNTSYTFRVVPYGKLNTEQITLKSTIRQLIVID